MKMPDQHEITRIVAFALAEDVGSGDITASLIPLDEQSTAQVFVREQAVICGQPWFEEVFTQLDSTVNIHWHLDEGANAQPDDLVCTLKGTSRSLLTGERSALNFLQTISGTATVSRQYARMIGNTDIKVLDTRKTIPGLRVAQKYATSVGGWHNHRMGLYDAFLIKENHIAACGGIAQAISKARDFAPGKPIEIEVESLDEYEKALAAGADIIMLDNFTPGLIREAVERKNSHVKIEISGNLDEKNLHNVAIDGVDFLSSGSLTKHCRAIDFSMRFMNSSSYT